MKAIDYRNATWNELRDHLHGHRASCYEAYLDHGPGTTRQIAEASGIDLLTLRPRTTELLQLGFLELVPEPDRPEKHRSKEGTYRALPMAAAEGLFLRRQHEATRETQLALL